MTKFIALLRAVNVGGTGTLSMVDLRRIAIEAGLKNVQTYIQSGNLIFTAPDAATAKAALESHLHVATGSPIGVILRSADALQTVLHNMPFANAAPNQVGVLFLNAAPPPDTITAAKGQTDEQIIIGVAEVYIHYPSGMGRSKLRLPVMQQGTTRNLNTIAKLIALATDLGAT
jgi:uncharacterized protein (DUF1697 family)